MGLANPFDEMLVKNPGNCPPLIDGDEAARARAGLGDV
jgi:hypothetical protein